MLNVIVTRSVVGRLAWLRWLVVFAAAWHGTAAHADDWPMGRGNPAGTAASQHSLVEPLELKWEVEIGGLGFDAGPIMADGKVFAADADGRVIALDLATGKSLWKLELENGFMASPSFKDGVLFVGDYNGVLRALDAATGQEKWQFAAELEIDGSPNFFGDTVLFTSQSGVLYALDLANGALRWKYETGDQLQCGATLAEDRTFLGGCDGYLHVIDVKTGQPVREPLPIDSPTGSTPSVADGKIFVPTYAGEILAFQHPTNELAWRFKDEKLSSEFKNSVAVSQGLLVASSRNRRVFAIDTQSGQVKWEHTLRKRSDSSPVIAGQRVVVAAADGRIVLLDLQSGEQTWMYEVKGGFLASPAVADGKLVVASDRGTLYCFESKPNP